jgi:hypothetical protein
VTHPIVERLASADPAERRAACLAAAEDASAVLLVDALCERLGDPVAAVVNAAMQALVQLAQRDPSVRSALDRALRGEHPRRRWGAALACAELEPPSLKLLPALVDAIGAPEGPVRWAAARRLVDMGRLHGEVLPVLLDRACKDPRPVARRTAVHALRELAPDRPDTAQVLVAATRDEDVLTRRAGLAALSCVLDPPAEVIQRLTQVLSDEADGASRRIAATALGELAAALEGGLPEAASRALHAAADDADDPDLRRAGARALTRARRAP